MSYNIRIIESDHTSVSQNDYVVIFGYERNTLKTILEKNPHLFECLSSKLRGDKELAMIAIKENGNQLKNASKSLRDDYDVVRLNSEAFAYASERLRDNEELARSASYWTFKYASKRVRSIRSIALEVVKKCGLNIFHLSTELLNDREVILAAIKNSKSIFKDLPVFVRDDKEIVMVSLNCSFKSFDHPFNFKILSERLQKDPEIIDAAIRNYPGVIKHVKYDEDFAVNLIRSKCNVYIYLSEQMKNNRKIALYSVQEFGYDYTNLPRHLQRDRTIVLAAVRYCFSLFYHIPKEFKNDREIVLAACLPYSEIPEAFKNDWEIILASVTEHGRAYSRLPEELKNKREIVILSVRQIAYTYKFIPEIFKHDKEIILLAISGDAYMYKFIPEEFKRDQDVINMVINTCGYAIKLFPDDLRTMYEHLENATDKQKYKRDYEDEPAKIVPKLEFDENEQIIVASDSFDKYHKSPNSWDIHYHSDSDEESVKSSEDFEPGEFPEIEMFDESCKKMRSTSSSDDECKSVPVTMKQMEYIMKDSTSEDSDGEDRTEKRGVLSFKTPTTDSSYDKSRQLKSTFSDDDSD